MPFLSCLCEKGEGEEVKSLGKFGRYGGIFAPEILMPALEELEATFLKYRDDKDFKEELSTYLQDYAGRPTPLYFAKNLSDELGFKVYLKREDLVHGGAHKLNNTLGQALLAKRMGKSTLITETAAGQQGLSVAIAGNALNLKTRIFMGTKDIERQRINAHKMKLYGAEVVPVTRGNKILKDAVDEAMINWIENLDDSHYAIGSTVGPHPFPTIVAHFQRVIGKEAREQILKREGKLPDAVVACGSGGSNALGVFGAFVEDKDVELIFVEGGGEGLDGERHAAALAEGKPGVFQGSHTYMLQDENGMVNKTSTRGTGLNYPARGPELSHLKDNGRLKATYAKDDEVLNAFQFLAKKEGIMPAFETAHAVAQLMKMKGTYEKNSVVIMNLSGRGDKDVATAISLLNIEI